jgi:hypothetical protein
MWPVVKVHSFVTATQGGVKWSNSPPAALSAGEEFPERIGRGLSGVVVLEKRESLATCRELNSRAFILQTKHMFEVGVVLLLYHFHTGNAVNGPEMRSA